MINFNFGKKKPDKKQIILVSIVISSIIATLSQCTGASEDGLWDLLDEIQRKYFPQTILNEIVIQDPDKVKRRVERDVTKSIDQVTPEYDKIIEQSDKVYKSKYFEKNINSNLQTKESRLLGGEMRICSHWIPDCTDK